MASTFSSSRRIQRQARRGLDHTSLRRFCQRRSLGTGARHRPLGPSMCQPAMSSTRTRVGAGSEVRHHDLSTSRGPDPDRRRRSVYKGTGHGRDVGIIEWVAGRSRRTPSPRSWCGSIEREGNSVCWHPARNSATFAFRRVVTASPSTSPNRVRRTDLYMFDLDSGIPTRFTADGHSSGPVWSPDGETTISSARADHPISTGSWRTDGAVSSCSGRLGGLETPLDVSSDGRLLVLLRCEPQNQQDLWLLPLGNDQEPRST